MKRSYIIIPGILIVLIAGYFFFSKTAHYETVTPKRGDTVLAVYATGEVEPITWARLTAPLTATVQELFADDGDNVTEGQTIALLDDHVEQNRLRELLAQQEFMAKEKERQESLYNRKVVSKFIFDKAVMDYDSITAQIEAQKRLLERLRIISPLKGIVLRRDVEPGELVKQGDPVFWVGEPNHLRITADVDEEDIALVKVGQKVLIKADAFPKQNMEGTIAEITPKGDPVNKNFRVRISLPGDTPLLIGMTVEVNVIIREVKHVLLVPATSVLGGKAWLVKGREPEPVDVVTGISDGEFVEVTSGIGEQDKILLNVSEFLRKK